MPLKTIQGFLFAILALIGLFYTLQITLPPMSKRTVAIIVLSLVIASLLALTRFAQTYHERKVREIGDEWSNRSRRIKWLSECRGKGLQLAELCTGDELPEQLLAQVKSWKDEAASNLEDQYGVDYRTRFFNGGAKDESFPTTAGRCKDWILDRTRLLEVIINEQKQIPQLAIQEAQPTAIQHPSLPAN